MKYPKRSQYKYAKSPYRIRNWPEYEAGIRRRRDLTVWLSDDAINSWRAPPSGRPGGQRTYANIAIEAALTIRMVFHLPLRQTEGFLRSLADMLEVEIPIPDHTTLSKRLKTLGALSFRAVANHRPIHLLIDSTGLRIHVGNLRKPPKNRIDPCIPQGWKSFEITYRYGDTLYRITVENPRGVCRGVSQVSLDGTPLARDAHVPLSDDGGEHQVQVVLG